MAHDPFRGAKRPPRYRFEMGFTEDDLPDEEEMARRAAHVAGPPPPDAAETPPASVSGPAAVPAPDPPEVAPEAQEGPVSLDTPLTDAATAEFKSALEREMAALNEAEAQVAGHPCRVCGKVMASPGALGGHMAAHRRRGELD